MIMQIGNEIHKCDPFTQDSFCHMWIIYVSSTDDKTPSYTYDETVSVDQNAESDMDDQTGCVDQSETNLCNEN